MMGWDKVDAVRADPDGDAAFPRKCEDDQSTTESKSMKQSNAVSSSPQSWYRMVSVVIWLVIFSSTSM
jgi:hypothetical protein